MRNKFIGKGILLVGLLLGCSESDLDQVNPNQILTDQYFKDLSELTKGVNSIYAIQQSANLLGREYWFLHDLRSDDVATGGGQLETPRNQLLTGVHDPANGVMNSVWNGLYRMIHRANVVIDRAAQVTDGTAEQRNQVVGQAKFLRAWAYYELVSLWGGVPLYNSYVTSVGGSQPRATEDQVYQQVIADLKDAQAALPLKFEGADLGRATRGAASTLLGRVYLQRGEYANAKTELQKVIDSKQYSLVDNYNDNFLEETEYNPESIYEVAFSKVGDFNWDADGNGNGNETTPRSQEYAAIGWRNLIPSNKLLAEYENTAKGDEKTDPRLLYSFYFIGDKFNGDKNTLTDAQVQGNTSVLAGKEQKISWRKYSAMYKTADTYYTSGINFRLMRYADVLLMMAEAENEAGTPQAAIGYLNQVRARKSVAMPPYPTKSFPVNSKAEIFRAVQHEREVELAGEQLRNRDLLRWRKQNKLTAEPLTYFQKGKHELLPIPQAEIDNNDKLEQKDQNPGY
ncbi:RagB/SusD family nutrient uptake outer membrane protein [Larkinella soli]|uniref:RagB/SusD family nutrient uptake outer membrane protein n=1 Tax=Larkinella soli TaxID=1770527 RepID=UPI000FFB1A25|nr:RagB/SusD family nutrient uptake outer membrane protein [Larkinella soli]